MEGHSQKVPKVDHPTLPLEFENTEPELSDTKPEGKKKLKAFGGYVKEELYKLFAGDQLDIDTVEPKEKDWIGRNLAEVVLTRKHGKRNKDNNDKDRGVFIFDGVPLNATEYTMIVRSPEKFGQAVVARTIQNQDLDDELVDKGQRSGQHAFESKLDSMQDHLQKLIEHRNMVKELQREIGMPGFAHKSDERMNQLTSVVCNELKTIIDVARPLRGWDDERTLRAKSALVAYMVTGGQRERVKHWGEMAQLCRNYLSVRISLFSKQISATQKRLG